MLQETKSFNKTNSVDENVSIYPSLHETESNKEVDDTNKENNLSKQVKKQTKHSKSYNKSKKQHAKSANNNNSFGRSKSSKEILRPENESDTDIFDEIIQVSFKSEDKDSFDDTTRSSISDESVKSSDESTNLELRNRRHLRHQRTLKNNDNFARIPRDNVFHKTRSPKLSLENSPYPSIHSTPIKHSTSLELQKRNSALISLKSCPSTPVASHNFTPTKRSRNGFRYSSSLRDRREKERGSGIMALSILCQYYGELVTALKVEYHIIVDD